MSARRCEQCGCAMSPRQHRQPHPVSGRSVCSGCAKLNTPEWTNMTYSSAAKNTSEWHEGFQHGVRGEDPQPPEGDADKSDQYFDGHEEGKRLRSRSDDDRRFLGSRKTAHDSGDGMDLAHCPFCGSGGITGGADGTVSCEFCHKFFTVQVQPEFKAMPQTIDGQPYNIPGMPGGGPDAGAAQDQRADDASQAQADGDPLPEEERDPNSDNPFADGPPQDGPPKKKQPNPFAKGSLLITAEGIALQPDAYLQHLALAYADDRVEVLSQVRRTNTTN